MVKLWATPKAMKPTAARRRKPPIGARRPRGLYEQPLMRAKPRIHGLTLKKPLNLIITFQLIRRSMKNFLGFIAYEGPSEIDGAVLLTGAGVILLLAYFDVLTK